jgi:hypothetical protein
MWTFPKKKFLIFFGLQETRPCLVHQECLTFLMRLCRNWIHNAVVVLQKFPRNVLFGLSC